jgi:hypothetical protein
MRTSKKYFLRKKRKNTKKKTRKMSGGQWIPEGSMCPICLEFFSNRITYVTPCNHLFCYDCIQQHIMDTAYHNTYKCPLCNRVNNATLPQIQPPIRRTVVPIQRTILYDDSDYSSIIDSTDEDNRDESNYSSIIDSTYE